MTAPPSPATPVVPRRIEAGPIAGALAAAAGIIAGQRAGAAAAAGVLGVGAAFVAAALLVSARVRAAVACVGIALLGQGLMQRALDGIDSGPLVEWRDARTSIVVRGTVADDAEGNRFSASVLVRVAQGASARDPTRRVVLRRTVVVRATGREASALRVLTAGDRVVVSGRAEPIDGFDARLRWRHVAARLADARVEQYAPPASLLARAAGIVRSTTMRGTSALAPTDRAVFAGFALGDTRDVPRAIVDEYRAAGLSHLLAVSGANVAFVLALAGPLLRRCSLGARALLGVAIVVVFAAATRFEPSVSRACAMAFVAMAASVLGRPVSPTRALSIAVVVLFLLDPFLVHSVGFGLSVGASAGIACCGPAITRCVRGPRWVREPLGVTLAAQLGVAPVLLPVFGSMPAVAPVANVLAVPAAEPLSVYGIAASLVLAVAAPLRPLARVVHLPTTCLLRWVGAVASVAAKAPLVVTARAALGLVAGAAIVGALVKAGATLRGDVPREPNLTAARARE